MLFVNDQDIPLNWLKRSEKALPRTQNDVSLPRSAV
nr:unnamed protein product [Callosobruchus analis]